MTKSRIYLLVITLFCLFHSYGKTYKVTTVEEFNKSVKTLVAGDSVVLASGVWKDAVLGIGGEGTADKPITLTVEDPLKTSLEGQSSLVIYGKYIVVDGLVFKNGYAPKDYVIQFRKDANRTANYSVLRNCVIDNYSKPNKTDEDKWISLWGQHNTVEYCYFAGKRNAGTTFVVWPNGEGNDKNFHHIYRNYFGFRPRLGSNGGETMRIGTSEVSLGSSNTLVEGNYFEHCNGEVEIISVKSCDNILKNNTFVECEGSLVLRHGNRNEVSGNYFIGNGQPFTGGVRVINEGHKVFNNYFHGLTGEDMRAPLCIMNGVPNSSLNRYNQVKDAEVSFNTWIDCALPWHMAYGSDAERSLAPANVKIANNIVYSTSETPIVKAYDNIDGISFSNNLLMVAGKNASSYGSVEGAVRLGRGASGIPQAITKVQGDGFDYVKDDIEGRARGSKKTVGAVETSVAVAGTIEMATAKNCGPRWSYKPIGENTKSANTGKTYTVEPGENTLATAVKKSSAGDIIVLKAGKYITTKKIVIAHSLTIKAADDAVQKAIVSMNADTETGVIFEIAGGAEFNLTGIALSGESSKMQTKYAIVTSKEMNKAYSLFIDNCLISNFKNTNSGAIFKAYMGTFGDTISIVNSQIKDCFRGLALNDEKDNKGLYSVENVVLYNTVFKDIEQWAIDFLRGGNDESTLGGDLLIDHCVFDNVNNKDGQFMIRQTGWLNVTIANSIFYNSISSKGVIKLQGVKHRMVNSCVYDVEKPKASAGAVLNNMYYENPKFEKNTFYQLSAKSPLINKALDGSNIGLKK